MGRHVVARVGEIPSGGCRLVHAGGRDIVVFEMQGDYYALLNRCPHEGGGLCHGDRVGIVEADMPGEYRFSRAGEMVKCPWHGWEFDIRTGQSWSDPRRTFVKKYPVSVEPGTELVKGPYVAESFPVTVEDDYVILEV